MGERCAWVNDPRIGAWFNPQCMGGAVYGEDQCTCPMPGGRIIIHHGSTPAGICADDLGPTVLLTVDTGDEQQQVDLYPSEYRRLGEWLIERANQAGEK